MRGEEQHALDNICGFARLMAHGSSYFLHFRWIHPHIIARGHRCGFDSGHSRPTSVRLTAEAKNRRPIASVGEVSCWLVSRGKSLVNDRIAQLKEQI